MNPGIIGVFIPILGISLAFFAIWTAHRQKLLKLEIQARTQKADMAHSERVDDLEDRLRVLERIVTDRGFDVAHQIEALRDERPLSGTALETRAEERLG